MDEKVTIMNRTLKAGITFHSPPKSAMSRVWRRS